MQFDDRVAWRMKLHDLRVLMAVAQAGSMNKAAVLLNMTQSAVSRSIAELEKGTSNNDDFFVELIAGASRP